MVVTAADPDVDRELQRTARAHHRAASIRDRYAAEMAKLHAHDAKVGSGTSCRLMLATS